MRAWWVVLATVAALACNSGTEPRVTAANPLADSADQVMFGVSTVITNRGVLRAQLAADTGYFFDGNSRIEVRREKTTFYTNTGQPNATLTSVEGTYNMRRGQMEARKNVVVVTTDATTQLKRLMDRDGCTEEAARVRVASQMPLAVKARYGDYVIDNSGPREQTEARVREVYRALLDDLHARQGPRG